MRILLGHFLFRHLSRSFPEAETVSKIPRHFRCQNCACRPNPSSVSSAALRNSLPAVSGSPTPKSFMYSRANPTSPVHSERPFHFSSYGRCRVQSYPPSSLPSFLSSILPYSQFNFSNIPASEVALKKAEYSDTWRGCRLYTGLCRGKACEVSLERAEYSDTWPGRRDFGAGREHVRRYLLYLCESEPARRTEMAM